MSPGSRANDRKTTQQDLQTGKTGKTSPDQSRSQALSPPPLQKNLRGMPDACPRSMQPFNQRCPTQSRLVRSSYVERNQLC